MKINIKIDWSFLLQPSTLIIGASFLLGIIATNINSYQNGYAKAIEDSQKSLSLSKPQTQPAPMTSPALPSPRIQTPQKPVLEKPPFYMGEIQGNLTYAHAIKIAQDYYANGAYENAMIWAYRANQIDPNGIQSYKITIESLEKIGETKQAQTLKREVEAFFRNR
ncbi:hypothetical protein [Helicobacter sp. 11S02596-1]|uniref:hypothetical protein n=1 Tax=Helicobacter sp. 11S02596-1 TaxID=1476194 RepID=UPI000BA5975A|nr:hypothetical protein [Helicobacter sp. 11S02596-1]PAF42357.1 hypothetical protein BJI48_07025 [Helicobacter sp. 11S02596-1]